MAKRTLKRQLNLFQVIMLGFGGQASPKRHGIMAAAPG